MSNSQFSPDNSHSKEKLDVYAAYLSVYLRILHYANIFQISIYDMFAGEGKYGDGNTPGSAILAYDIIRKHRKRHNADVRLYLNDKDKNKYRNLRKIAGDDIDKWVFCDNKTAHDAIKQHTTDQEKRHQIFYLDPYGYSQIKKMDLDSIVHSNNTECLLFVPVSHIARFVKNDQTKAIHDFLQEYGIDRNTNAKTREWISIIKDAFVRTYQLQHVGMIELKAQKNYYALYFIGNHIYGLHKFLEAVNKIKEGKGKELQLELIPAEDKEFVNYLSRKKQTNNELYLWGLHHGWLPAKTRETLTDMEEKGEISVELYDKSKTRRQGVFYLGYEHYKESPKLVVKLYQEGLSYGN